MQERGSTEGLGSAWGSESGEWASGVLERERNITVWLPLTWPPLGTWPATQACALTGN